VNVKKTTVMAVASQ